MHAGKKININEVYLLENWWRFFLVDIKKLQEDLWELESKMGKVFLMDPTNQDESLCTQTYLLKQKIIIIIKWINK